MTIYNNVPQTKVQFQVVSVRNLALGRANIVENNFKFWYLITFFLGFTKFKREFKEQDINNEIHY